MQYQGSIGLEDPISANKTANSTFIPTMARKKNIFLLMTASRRHFCSCKSINVI
jgi:hypothetical protein